MIEFNHPYNKDSCKDRLYNEYLEHSKLIVAFDFDNTIYDYHHTGGNYDCIVELLKRCGELGFELVLLTTEEDPIKLSNKFQYARKVIGYPILVNTSSIFSNASKPYYNILLDDRAGLEESFEVLNYVINKISKNDN